MDEMIQIHAGDGSYDQRPGSSFSPVIQILEKNRRQIYQCPSEIIIRLLGKLGREVVKDPTLGTIPGLPYLSLWLREENINNIYKINFGRTPGSHELIPVDPHHGMMAFPRGIVCHWIAGNIPFLGIFSMVLALLGKNASILKVSPDLAGYICLILQKLEKCVVSSEGTDYHGDILSRSVAVVSFSGKNERLSQEFSLAADCRVIYGGEDAITVISRLPSKMHAETIQYGPKYSFAIFDQETIGSPLFQEMADGLARDIVLYNQAACSSPHVIFCEAGAISVDKIVNVLEDAFKRVPPHLYHPLDESIAVSVINTRGRYLLDDKKQIRISHDLSWTICISDECSLEEPIQGRCIFLKSVNDVYTVLDLVTWKIQTVALGMVNHEKRMEYSKELAYRGVDRIMTPGSMNEYTQPWDGILSAGRMVRWVTIRRDKYAPDK